MNISEKQYAESLYEAVGDKKDGQIKDVIKNFVKLLVKNNDISKADKIVGQFEKLWNKEKGIVEAEVMSAKELGSDIAILLNCYIVKLSKAKKVILNKKIDKKILGGVVIKYEDKVLDGSLKTRLGELKNKMVK